jgi:ARC6-like, IMS domain/Double-GTPase 2
MPQLIGGLIAIAIVFTIIYYTLNLAFFVMSMAAIGSSLWGALIGIKSFFLAFVLAHAEAKKKPARTNPLKFVWPRYTPQPARLMYFYDAGWVVIKDIGISAFAITILDASKIKTWASNLINEGKFYFAGSWFGKIRAVVYNYGIGLGLYLGWIFHFVAALAIVSIFIGIQFIFLSIGAIFTTFITSLLAIGTYIYGSFYKVYYRCPNCHDQIKIPKYICSNPNCLEEHTRLWPSVYGVTHHTCLSTHNGNLCGQSLPTLTFLGRDKLTTRCPSCDYQLEGLGGTNAHFPIVGDPNSGKSTYTIMAVQEFIDEYASRNRLQVKFPDPLHQQKYESSVSLLNAGRFPLKTTSADDGAKAINLELKTPNQAVPNLLYLYDTAGEDTATDDKAVVQGGYFKYVNGVFFIIDPFSIPQIYNEYKQELSSQSKTSMPSEQNLDALFARMLELFETKTQLGGGNKKFSQPIAVILTKTDECNLEDKVGLAAARRYMQNNPGKVQTEQDAINILVEEFLRDRGANNLVLSLHQYFSNVRFFSCSALGTNASPNKPFEGLRVLDSMLWLFDRANVLPNKANAFNRVVRSKPWIKYGLPIIATGAVSGILYAGYAVTRWSIVALNLKLPSWQQEQNITKLPVNSVTQPPLDFDPNAITPPSSQPPLTSDFKSKVITAPSPPPLTSASPANTSNLTKQDAANIIGRWFVAKKSAFGSSYNKTIGEQITIGQAYERNITARPGDEESSADYFRMNGKYYTYEYQEIHDILSINVLSSNEVLVKALVSEHRTLHSRTGSSKQSKTNRESSCYLLQKDGSSWKISKDPTLLKSCN